MYINMPCSQSTPSGALTLDLALGGGYPKGRVIEIYGPESAGKTTLALHALAEVQKSGGNVALIDAEHAFDPVFAKHLGVDIDSLYLCQPDSGEMALEVADQLIRSSAMDMIAVDSVAALVPRAEIEGEIGQLQVGAQARLMSAALRKIAGNASRHNCSIIFLNQLRQKVGVIYGSPEVTSGGQALKYYSSVRMEVRIKERIAGSDGQIGIRVKARCTKNKVAPPYKLAEFDVLFGSGISANGCLLDAAEAIGVIARRGSYYFFGDARLGQGREKTLETLKTDDALRRCAIFLCMYPCIFNKIVTKTATMVLGTSWWHEGIKSPSKQGGVHPNSNSFRVCIVLLVLQSNRHIDPPSTHRHRRERHVRSRGSKRSNSRGRRS